MTDPFGADALDIAPVDGRSFEISSPAGPIGRASVRPARSDGGLRGLRHALDRRWTGGSELTIEDVHGHPRYGVVRSGGRSLAFDMTLVDEHQQVLGTAGVESIRMTRMFPDVRLTGPAGEPLGHVTTAGRSEAYDATGRLVAEMHVGATKAVFGKPLHQVRFVQPVPDSLRALVVAVVLCRTLR